MQCKSIKWKYRGLLAGACFATLLVAGAAGSAYGADYTPVTDARLANPEPENWLMTRGNYKGWSYSALDQINAYNVKNLVPVWSSRPEWIPATSCLPSLTTVSCSSRRRTARS